jgi:hypothetical protein
MLKYVRWSSIFALPASTAANVGSILRSGIGITTDGNKPDVFLLFKGLGGDMSRDRLRGTSIAFTDGMMQSTMVGSLQQIKRGRPFWSFRIEGAVNHRDHVRKPRTWLIKLQ